MSDVFYISSTVDQYYYAEFEYEGEFFIKSVVLNFSKINFV